MTFVTASLAMAGLLAASIPIIIHLLSRQRRKPIEWAAMRFLLEAMRKHRRRLRTEQLLLLAVRCLIVILFGAALARPLLSSAGILDRGGDRVVYLLIDNGLASGLTDESGSTSLETHVQQAIDIIRSLSPTDRVGIATAARPAQLILSPPTADHGSVIRLLESLSPLDAPTDIAGTLRAMRPALEDHSTERAHAYVYLLSDLRAGSARIESPLPAILRDMDAADHVTLLVNEPAQHPISNVQIVRIDPVRHVVIPGAADGSGQITVRLERHGGELGLDVTRVRLQGDGIGRVEPRVVRWEQGQSQASVDFLVRFAPTSPSLAARGSTQRDVVLTAAIDNDALNADNVHHVVLEMREQLRVALLDRRSFGFEPTIEGYRSSQWIRRALAPGNGSISPADVESNPVRVLDVDPSAVSAADIRTADVVILTRPDLVNESGWIVLREYVDRAGVLLVMPPDELNVHPWVERFTASMELPWRIALETVHDEVGVALASEQPASEILRLISSDLEELVRPVAVYRTLPVEAEQSGGYEPLLQLANGRPLVVAASPGTRHSAPREDRGEGHEEPANAAVNQSSGLVLYLASATQLEWTNLPGKPLMVPLMNELVRQGVSSVKAMHRVTAGEQPMLASGSVRELVKVSEQSEGTDRVAIDETGRAQRPVVKSGVYALRDGAGQHVSTLAVNVDPHAGRTESLATAAIMSWLAGAAPGAQWNTFDTADPSAAIHRADRGSPIAWLLLLIVLGFVVIETLLQRWFSHASTGGDITQTKSPKRHTIGMKRPLTAGGAA